MVDVLFLPSVLLFISSGEDIPFSAYIRRKIGTLLDHLICGPFAQILFHKNIFRLSLGADKPAGYGRLSTLFIVTSISLVSTTTG